MSKTFTGTVNVWLSEYAGPDLFKCAPEQVVKGVFFAQSDMSQHGYTFVGQATVTFTAPDERQLVQNKVESLKVEKRRVLADAQKKATELEEKIQTLLAISWEGERQ